MYKYSKMNFYGICLSGRKKGEKPKSIKMDTYELFQFPNGRYYVRGESSKCPHTLNSIVSKENAIKLANGAKIPIWKGDPATKKKREAIKKRKIERKEKKKEAEKAKKLKEKAKKLKEKEKTKKKTKKN